MTPSLEPLGRTLIIANPVAQSGAGARIAERLQRFLGLYHHDAASFELVYTEYERHAVELARRAAAYDSVVALGGDGVVHEVANGLMDIAPASRPALGVVPVGSGNDFARTLGLTDFSGNDFARCPACTRTPFDVGRIVVEGEGTRRIEYFVETFSFGLDAAVALGTYSLRGQTHLTGAPLYLLSGANVFLKEFRAYPARVSVDGGAALDLRTFLMAVQLGPTYGSGFLICPDADPTDGLLDICYASGAANRATALALLLRAKGGHHRGSRLIHAARGRRVRIELGGAGYPMQADGERLVGERLSIDVLPGALTVLRPIKGQEGATAS